MPHDPSVDDPKPPVPLEYASPDRSRSRFRPLLMTLLILIAPLLLVAFILPGLGRARPAANKIKCAANLKGIAQAMMMYAQNHGGAYPDSFETLILSLDLATEQFICPACDLQKATGATIQQAARNLTAKPGHLSYVYLGRGLTMRAPAETVLAYELPANHGNEGINVLFGDGHVEFRAGEDGRRFLAELHSGHNPPRAEVINPNPSTVPAVAP